MWHIPNTMETGMVLLGYGALTHTHTQAYLFPDTHGVTHTHVMP